ncbi:hypothetical protein PIB30_084638 [Stylosanthes scabra]|uniref:Uncharacterized protein n=1 Tax=Stylosanthes scabra TaxID=79078 RepID=A0ABU6TS36_9FABA|nr:hypothetical protein [Stylosanthes scabra]
MFIFFLFDLETGKPITTLANKRENLNDWFQRKRPAAAEHGFGGAKEGVPLIIAYHGVCSVSGHRKEVIFKCKYLARASKRADFGDQSLELRGEEVDLQSHSDAQVNKMCEREN